MKKGGRALNFVLPHCSHPQRSASLRPPPRTCIQGMDSVAYRAEGGGSEGPRTSPPPRGIFVKDLTKKAIYYILVPPLTTFSGRP